MAMLAKTIFSLFFASLPGQIHASAFLGRYGEQQLPSERASAAFEGALLADLESVLGSEHRVFTQRRLSKIEEVVRPIYQAMPKNEHGKLGHGAVSYVLHRLFAQRHAWFIKGLEPEGKGDATWNATSPVTLFTGKVPEYVQSTFEQRMGNSGMGVHDIAIVAATLEHLVHKEAIGRLKLAYVANQVSPEDVVSTSGEALEIFDNYMAVYVLGFLLGSKTDVDPEDAKELRAHVAEIYPTWPDTQQFIREVQESVSPSRDYLYFSDMATVIEEAGERYGRWQDRECRILKETLLAVEDTGPGGAGRVRLAEFYKLALHDGKWQFSESQNYLRRLGSLDESDPNNPRVIIANYVNGPSNCVSSSSYFAVCCIDECDSLLAHLEQKLAKPDAYPMEITTIVRSLMSATQQTNRTLSPWLLQQLNEVAAIHGGLVPLHGRLFTQWMHFAYPRECPYPHLSGTIEPLHLSEIVESEESVMEATINETAMQGHIDAVPARVEAILNASSHEEITMLSMEEELVVWRTSARNHRMMSSTTSSLFRAAAFFCAVVATTLGLVKGLEIHSARNPSGCKSLKYFV